jgi:hypothetical protein
MPVETVPKTEALPVIELSPERVGQALNLEADEVRAQLSSVEGRKKLLSDLTSDPVRLQSVIDPESLRTFESDMEMTEQDLHAQEKFLEAQKNPEKKGMFRRAWDTITGFPRKHPVITVTLLGVVLGVVASYMGWLPSIDFAGLWGRAQGWMGWGTAGEGAAETAAEGAAAQGAVEIGKEVAAGSLETIPEAFRIRIFEHSFLYGNKIYSMEELPTLLEQLPELPKDEFFRILPYGNSRVTAEMALKQALEEKGVASSVLEKLAGTEFIPTAP